MASIARDVVLPLPATTMRGKFGSEFGISTIWETHYAATYALRTSSVYAAADAASKPTVHCNKSRDPLRPIREASTSS